MWLAGIDVLNQAKDLVWKFRERKQHHVPILNLTNLGELIGPSSIHSGLAAFYVAMQSGMAKIKVKGYVGIFDQVPANWRQEGRVSSHASEMPYVFGALDEMRAPTGPGRSGSAPVITGVDRNVREALMRMWTRFAKTGNPSVKGLAELPPCDLSTDRHLCIAEPLQVRSGFSRILQEKR